MAVTFLPATVTAPSLVDRLREHLVARIDHQGLVRSACGSRVLETVLASRLLQDDDRHPDALAAARSYLHAAARGGELTPLDRALLGKPSSGLGLLAGFEHHTAGRKRLLMNAILHAAGVGGAPAPPPTTDPAGGLHTWKQAELAACRVICDRAACTPVAGDDLDALADLLLKPRIFEGNHLPHLLFLHALRPYPACRAAVRQGIDLLVATQHADGGFSVAESFDTWVTSIVATALTEAGTDRQTLARTADWLAARQAGDGGWSYTPQATQTDMDTTYTAMVFLHHHDPVRHARTWRPATPTCGACRTTTGDGPPTAGAPRRSRP
ncbi:prenyltransferase/squalene oxidase repeat-containing protein [Streptomyces sp. NPDC059525]|uniref:prenyltransferase/squalene oxidase repeat-containing protein n=1 Tax=Streptomyces sp. NPDC059525 TaxID=3346857 RepID=UPI00367E7649